MAAIARVAAGAVSRHGGNHAVRGDSAYAIVVRSAMKRLPEESAATATALFSFASIAGPPSPEKPGAPLPQPLRWRRPETTCAPRRPRRRRGYRPGPPRGLAVCAVAGHGAGDAIARDLADPGVAVIGDVDVPGAVHRKPGRKGADVWGRFDNLGQGELRVQRVPAVAGVAGAAKFPRCG